MKNKILNIGIVGSGFISQMAHIPNYALTSNCNIVALAELRTDLRNIIATRYKVLESYSTHKELLTNFDIDAVVVISQRNKTGPIAFDCLNAGKHVMTEKPMAGDFTQAKRLVEAAKKNKVHYAVGYMRRHDSGIRYAKRLIDQLSESNELGNITFVRMHCFQGEDYCNIDGFVDTDEMIPNKGEIWPEVPEWIPDKYKDNYKKFINVFCHNINLIRFLFNKTPSVEYVKMTPENGRLIVFNFGEYSCSLEAGKYSYQGWDEVIDIFFEHGRLTIKPPPALLKNVPAYIELYKGNTTQQLFVPHMGWSWAFRNQAEAFVNDILNSNIQTNSGEDALKDMLLIENIWKKELQ